MSKRNDKSKTFDATPEGKDSSMPQFTCCDCNETLADDLQGYHSLERCIDCEARLIDLGSRIREDQDELRIAWLEACTYDGFDGSLAEYREGRKDQ